MSQLYTYTARIKTRKQIDAEIPRHLQGWWADVCPGRVVENLRDATVADLQRCNLNALASRDPKNYLCENIPGGALIRRDAIQWLRMELPLNFVGVDVPMVDVCDAGHPFAVGQDHPRAKDGRPLCIRCVLASLQAARDELASIRATIAHA